MILECQVHAGLIGDSLSTIPFMLHQAESHEVYCTGDFAAPLIPLCKTLPIKFSTIPSAPEKTYILRCGDAWQWNFTNGWQHHMSQAYFAIHGFPIPAFPQINFYEQASVFQPGIVISPFARSDGNFTKRWCVNRWREFIHHFLPEHPIYVIGADIDDTTDFEADGAHALKGFSFPEVLGLLKASKAVVTIDTGTNHLCALSGVHRHVLLYPDGLPPKLAESPYAQIVRGATNMDISVGAVVAAVERLL